MAFKEDAEALKAELKKGITKDTPTDEITRIEGLCTKIDGLSKEHEATTSEMAELKDKYIKNVLNYGTTENPKGETPRTLEEIAKAVSERDAKQSK